MIKLTDAKIDAQQKLVEAGSARYVNPARILWMTQGVLYTGKNIATGNKVTDPSKQPDKDGNPVMMDEMVPERVIWTDLSMGNVTFSVIETPEQILELI